jgi:hypothetical protein
MTHSKLRSGTPQAACGTSNPLRSVVDFLSMRVLAVLLSLLSLCSAEFYDIRYPIPPGYRVANTTDWDNLYLSLLIFFQDHPDLIPKYVRMAFHDVANFKADATSTGGRGCILYDFYANMTMNRGLMSHRNTLIGNMFLFWDVYKISYGWGDAVQLAGKAALETAFPCIAIEWGYGRPVCDGREKEGGPGPLIRSSADLNPFLNRYGMTATEMAILLTGSHGVANGQNIFADTGINSFTMAFIDSGIDFIARTVNKPEPWVFFFTWFGLDLVSFPFDPNFDPAHGDVPFITRGTLGRFNSDMMFFPSQVARSIPVLFTIPNASTDAADVGPLSAIETRLRGYLTKHPAHWEMDFVNVYNKMSRIGTAGYTITSRYPTGVYTSCTIARLDVAYLGPNRQLVTGAHLGRMNIPRDYKMTFSITAKGTTATVTNILHATAVILFDGRPTILQISLLMRLPGEESLRLI